MATVKTSSVNNLMSKAQQALARNHWFEAERLAVKALEMARTDGDFNLMARITLPLQEARRQRMQIAFDSRKLVILDAPMQDEAAMEGVCYLLQPPLVGSESRRLRLLALEREIPAVFLCREPKTLLGLCPVVAIGQVTVRARIDPPRKWDKPDLAWYLGACEQLGDAAIESLDTAGEPSKRVDALLERLDTRPDHETIHHALAEACKAAALAYAGTTAPARGMVKVRTGEEKLLRED